MLARATFSPDGVYRYRLLRRWSRGARVVWVMLNPSTADAQRDDPTIRRCIGFSRAWGFGAMEVVNLYALRATEPGVVRGHDEPVGPENDRYIVAAASRGAHVIAAWGAFPWAAARADHVLELLMRARRPVRCLGLTRGGHPRHPLYARADARPIGLGASATL